MIKLYHCADARSFRALWALEEVGAPYELELLPFPPRFMKREYLQINPLGTIPCLIDGDTKMTESAAICQYLGDRYSAPPLIVARDEPAYGAYLNALHFGEATLTFPQTIVLRYGALEPPDRRVPQVATDYTRWTIARMRAFLTMLAGAEYVAAGRFTMADISVGYSVLLARSIGIGGEVPEALNVYFERISARPAFARAKAAQGEGFVLPQPDPR
jgi:glutathione S-transferase